MTNYYDAFGQPTTILQTMDGSFRYTSYYHDDSGNLVRLTHSDGPAFGYAYDALGRMTLVQEVNAVAGLDDLVIRYWYNAAGSRHAAVRGAGTGGFYTVWYRDALERPTIIANDLPGSGDDAPIELGYNPASQITSRTVSNIAYAAPSEANRSLAYQVNGLNQYREVSNRTYAYDSNGNLAADGTPGAEGTTSYVYDVENRLVSASGFTSATLVYDPLGRLVQTSTPGGATAWFLYDGDRIIAEYDGSGAMTKRYVHGPGADEPVAVYEGAALGLANRRYMMPDERGSIAALINADGTPWWINRYDAWGAPNVDAEGRSINQGRFQYTGQAWIPELGMYHYKARIYSPRLGRFMQTDPIGYEDQMNLYAYVGNDPINGTDPSGECGLVNGPNDTKIEAGICGTTPEAQAFVDGRIEDSTSAFGATEKAALARGEKISVAFGSEITDPRTGNSRPVDGGESQALEYSSGRREVIVVLDPSDEVTLSGNPIVLGKESERVASMEEIAEHEVAGHARDHIERRSPSEQEL